MRAKGGATVRAAVWNEQGSLDVVDRPYLAAAFTQHLDCQRAESVRAAQEKRLVLRFQRACAPRLFPVVVDDEKCIAEKGCRVCIDVCPLDVLAINDATGKAHMRYDECWYCMPCEVDCPTGAVKVNIPYLLR